MVVNCAVRLHRDLGPGLLESVYEVILAKQLQTAGLKVKVQAPIPIEFEGMRFSEAFRADIIVEGRVILELKSVEKITRAHRKQVLTYLKLTGMKLGFILNFGAATMREGIARIINGTIT